MTVKRNFELIC